MNSKITTYQAIADILSFETSNALLEVTLSATNLDWDAIVVHGSQHLILPTIFCRLKKRQLLHLLPDDLQVYLGDITDQNRERNKAILEEIYFLSELLNNNNIEHVFLKGAALLASGYYEDIAERMIGDIDILVSKNHLGDAFTLLKQHSFKPIPLTFGKKYFEHKHLPRMTTNKYIAAVELHLKLFVSYQKKDLHRDIILKKKIVQSKVYIPHFMHLLQHNILNNQINDSGYRYKRINFRTMFDTVVLNKTSNFTNISVNSKTMLLANKYIKNYFEHANVFFTDSYKFYSKRAKFFLFFLNHPRLNYLRYRLIKLRYFTFTIVHRSLKAIINTHYRKDLWQDRKRVIKILKSSI